MEFLSPIPGIVAAAVTVPLLVLMYFLRLRRTEVAVSSTLLWRRAVKELQVNAPFQRIRRNILLLLQLLAMAFALLALARPTLELRGGPARMYVLLIDHSASMSTREGGKTRLDEARRQAGVVVDSLRSGGLFGGSSDQAMVIAFDDRAKVMCNFTADQRKLRQALDAIEPTDGGSSLAEAFTVARALAQGPGVDANNRSAVSAAQLVLFSDGRIADVERLSAASGELVYHCVGQTDQNVGIVAMQVRRSFEKLDEVNVFATLANYGPQSVTCDLQLTLDGVVRSVRAVTLPPRKPAAPREPARPGRSGITFTLNHPGSAVIELRKLQADVLDRDDTAWSILLPPKRLSGLLVTDGNIALSGAMRACPLAKLEQVTHAELAAMDLAAMNLEHPYDVIVIDGRAPAKLPRGRYIIFGPPPPDIGVEVDGTLRNQATVDWRSRHPVLQHLNLVNFYAGSIHRLRLPRDAHVLSEFSDGPGISLLARGGSQFLLAPFDVLETNWPFEPAFVMFMYNAVHFLGTDLGQLQQLTMKVGDPISVQGRAGEAEAAVTGPGLNVKAPVDAGGSYRFAGTSRAGLYAVTPPGRPGQKFAVNLLDEAESDVGPQRELNLLGQSVVAQAGQPSRGNREMWPYLALAALALVLLEWFVYNSKLRL